MAPSENSLCGFSSNDCPACKKKGPYIWTRNLPVGAIKLIGDKHHGVPGVPYLECKATRKFPISPGHPISPEQEQQVIAEQQGYICYQPKDS